MAFDFLMVAAGILLLLVAGDALVKGAVNLALRLGIPALVVSLTVVAFGTSAPELLVSVSAVLDNAPGLALGNVIGSNTANVLLVIGIPAIISTIHITTNEYRASYLQMIGATVLFLALALTGHVLRWPEGIVLVGALLAMIGYALWTARCHRKRERERVCEADDTEVEGADPSLAPWKIAAFLIGGLIGLPLGANLLVEGATHIAKAYGVSDTVIGLTLVAVGTSLPELATSAIAAMRKQADVALGNVIGSNMFNLLGILGITALVGPLPLSQDLIRFDLWVMLGSSLVLGVFVLGRIDVKRSAGIVLLALYGLYVGMLLT
ncbi:Inner membrane protein YrbG [Aquimixticola soesokkakensis]|uniref:Inner membrane protein YrbG n=1 Tax=Aquimixticola soesokkakensis TaxID=1519096 RepID=A0A1Y5TLJ8_9RHOB|nr:calcium/sodium antiporter [Aquimixticola soesokkakensis]SLN66909.1 Inner membrane protein YrbG [Aquimixticola soesokkakensis]